MFRIVYNSLKASLSKQTSVASFLKTIHPECHRHLSKMTTSTNPALHPSSSHKFSIMPYTNCNTRIVDLKSLNLSESATETEYRDIYNTLINIIPKSTLARDLEASVQSLTSGIAPPVAFPTETVYGLGADATNSPAVAGIFAAKGRPSDNPLIVHVASKEHLERLTGEQIPSIYRDLVKDYWPGPLTILVPIPKFKSRFARNVHPGQETVGFRVPSSKYARFLISVCNRPIAAPSANSSGKPSPTTAQHVLDDLKGKINFILDGGSCDVGVESTVVDGLQDPPLILRPGGVSRQELVEFGRRTRTAWERVGIGYTEHQHQDQQLNDHDEGFRTYHQNGDETPRAPGMKYKHYAPQGKLILFLNFTSTEPVRQKLAELLGDTILPATSINGCTTPSNQPEVTEVSLNIAILTTSKWPDFANIDNDASTLDSTETNGKISTAPLSSNPAMPTSIPIKSKFVPLLQFSHHRHNDNKTSVRIHTLSLGRTPTSVARSLFAALRTCDDLDCNYIFAEAPEQLEGHEGRDWEVVMERMSKAASEIVHGSE